MERTKQQKQGTIDSERINALYIVFINEAGAKMRRLH